LWFGQVYFPQDGLEIELRLSFGESTLSSHVQWELALCGVTQNTGPAISGHLRQDRLYLLFEVFIVGLRQFWFAA